MDHLIELPKDDWRRLRDMYGTKWPETADAFCFFDMLIKHPGLSEDFDVKVYCPEGNLTNGVVAVSSRCQYYEVMIHPMPSNEDESTEKIKKALLNSTTLIDWDRTVTCPAASTKIIEILEAVKGELGVDVLYGNNTRAHEHIFNVKDETGQETKWRHEIILPPNTYIRPLKTEHIDLIDKTWTFHNEHSRSYFETLQKHNLIHAVYSSLDELLAWVGIDKFGAFTHLFCLEEHRKKGYAELITKYAVNYLLEKGQNVLAYTEEPNVKPKRLFSKLGFKFDRPVDWVEVMKRQ